MIYHLKAYGFLFPIKDAVRILELLPCCHGNMHSGIFRYIRSILLRHFHKGQFMKHSYHFMHVTSLYHIEVLLR